MARTILGVMNFNFNAATITVADPSGTNNVQPVTLTAANTSHAVYTPIGSSGWQLPNADDAAAFNDGQHLSVTVTTDTMLGEQTVSQSFTFNLAMSSANGSWAYGGFDPASWQAISSKPAGLRVIEPWPLDTPPDSVYLRLLGADPTGKDFRISAVAVPAGGHRLDDRSAIHGAKRLGAEASGRRWRRG